VRVKGKKKKKMEVDQMQRQYLDYTKSLFLEVRQINSVCAINSELILVLFSVADFVVLVFLRVVREGVLGWSISTTSAATR